MIQQRKSMEEGNDSCSPTSVVLPSQLTPMELKMPKYMHIPPVFPSTKMESSLEEDQSFFCNCNENPFADAFADPLCKLNLKETSEFVRAFPISARICNGSRNLLETSAHRRREGLSSVVQRRMLPPSTPGRPLFGFSAANLGRKSIPSKWEDAEKWLISSSCHESPAHVPSKTSDSVKADKHDEVLFQKHCGPDTFKVLEEKLPPSVCSSFNGLPFVSKSGIHGFPSEVLLKDKFTDNVEAGEPILPCFQGTEQSIENFLFSNSICETMKDRSIEVVAHHRDIGTEMSPFGSSATSRCHTPIKTSSPVRHNTPADRSGLLVPRKPSIDLSELKGCHLVKLELGSHFDSVFPNWSSKEEEDEEILKSLRHLETDGGRKNIADSRAVTWEDEEKAKSCIRYQREEAKIQAWQNLQSAKAEAKSRKLEVKIQKMRSNLEEKLTKRMATVQRRAQEWRVAAQLQHSQQIQRAQEQAQKMKLRQPSHFSEDNTRCSCLPPPVTTIAATTDRRRCVLLFLVPPQEE